MGFLEAGVPIPWEDLTEEVKQKVRRDGLKQLLHIWSVNESRQDSELYWGDEQEFTVVHLDQEKREAKLVLEAPRILAVLNEKEATKSWDQKLVCCKQLFLNKPRRTFLRGAEWHPEFGNHMIEATPSPPYSLTVEGLLDIEESMTSRRLKLQDVLTSLFDDVYACSLSAFPNFGVLNNAGQADYIYGLNPQELQDFLDGSNSVVARLPNPHPRFPTLVKNVNRRRGTKVSCLMPVEGEADWSNSLNEIPKDRDLISEQSKVTTKPVKGYSYEDSFAHGMSLCCLQVTFGAPTLQDSLYLYDQMVVLAPLFLALSAATPALFGHISALDTRWKVLEQTCDCRTKEELATIMQSRYGHAPMFISDNQFMNEHENWLNDDLLPYNKEAYEMLKNRLPEKVARHFATLWLRDPLVVFSDKIYLDNKTSANHFENIQSTNWNTVRFKPPPPSLDGVTPSTIGWRVELRTPDLQLSDFQNAALSGIASLLALAILKERWNFYIPISQARRNMETAHEKDSCISRKFWTRNYGSEEPSSVLRSLQSIFLDKDHGIISRLDKFVSTEWRAQRCSSEAVEKYRVYSAFVRNRVLGRTPTNARELRDLIHRQQVVLRADEDEAVSTPIKSKSPIKEPCTPPTACTTFTYDVPAKTSGTIDHNLNFEVVKYSVLAGYDHSIQLANQDVHSTVRNAPKCLHICKQSPVLKTLSKLVAADLPENLPHELVRETRTAEEQCSERSSPATPTEVLSGCCL